MAARPEAVAGGEELEQELEAARAAHGEELEELRGRLAVRDDELERARSTHAAAADEAGRDLAEREEALEQARAEQRQLAEAHAALEAPLQILQAGDLAHVVRILSASPWSR